MRNYWVVTAVLVSMVGTVAEGTIKYTIADLKPAAPWGGLNWDPVLFDINNSGQAVGSTMFAWKYGLLYDPNKPTGQQFTNLGTVGTGDTVARSINDGGTIVGEVSYVDHSQGNDAAFMYDGSMHLLDLGPITSSTANSARQVNNNGQIVGAASATGAYVYDGTGRHDLGTLGGTGSTAFGINNNGQVVGTASRGAGLAPHAFLYDPSKPVEQQMQDLGEIAPNQRSIAYQVNNAGQAVGLANNSASTYHAMMWDNTRGMQDLGVLGGNISQAMDINNIGLVVGRSTYDDSGATHAFIYDGVMHDLNDFIDPQSGWTLTAAGAINDSGQIVAWGSFWDGQNGANSYALLLTPLPEPGTIGILLVAAGMGLMRRRRVTSQDR